MQAPVAMQSDRDPLPSSLSGRFTCGDGGGARVSKRSSPKTRASRRVRGPEPQRPISAGGGHHLPSELGPPAWSGSYRAVAGGPTSGGRSCASPALCRSAQSASELGPPAWSGGYRAAAGGPTSGGRSCASPALCRSAQSASELGPPAWSGGYRAATGGPTSGGRSCASPALCRSAQSAHRRQEMCSTCVVALLAMRARTAGLLGVVATRVFKAQALLRTQFYSVQPPLTCDAHTLRTWPCRCRRVWTTAPPADSRSRRPRPAG